jgi:hypothetical protein
MTLLSQKNICSLAALVCTSLCLVLLFVPGLIFWLFSMAHDVGGVLIARRAAMLFAGLGFLAWSARNLAPSAASKAIFQAFSIAMGGLAMLGVYEFLRGNVGVGIGLAVVAEVFFATMFARFAARIT